VPPRATRRESVRTGRTRPKRREGGQGGLCPPGWPGSDVPGLRAHILHGHVGDVGGVGTSRWRRHDQPGELRGADLLDHRDWLASEALTAVRGKMAPPSASAQCRNEDGALQATPGGTRTRRDPRRRRSPARRRRPARARRPRPAARLRQVPPSTETRTPRSESLRRARVNHAAVVGDDQSGPGPDRVEQRLQGRGRGSTGPVTGRGCTARGRARRCGCSARPPPPRWGARSLEALEGGPPQIAEPSWPGRAVAASTVNWLSCDLASVDLVGRFRRSRQGARNPAPTSC